MFDFDVLEISKGPDAAFAPSQAGGTTVAQAMATRMVLLEKPATEIPRGPALALSPEAGVAAAMESMLRRDCRAAIVVQNHRPVGVVTERDILRACGDAEDLRSLAIGAVMSACDEPLTEADTVAQALRAMCARRQWHLPIVCGRGLFLGALDIADIALWLRDRMTLISVDAALAGAAASM